MPCDFSSSRFTPLSFALWLTSSAYHLCSDVSAQKQLVCWDTRERCWLVEKCFFFAALDGKLIADLCFREWLPRDVLLLSSCADVRRARVNAMQMGILFNTLNETVNVFVLWDEWTFSISRKTFCSSFLSKSARTWKKQKSERDRQRIGKHKSSSKWYK